jgi:hypothetical protein
MLTGSKRNEHPRCSCRSCRLGAGRMFGQFVHRKVNRAIRHRYKEMLGKLTLGREYGEPSSNHDWQRIIVSTTYTD